MNEQDIINLILGEPGGDFHGTVPSEGKRQQFDRLRGHAGALMRHTHGSLDHSRADGNPLQCQPDARRAASRRGTERIRPQAFFHAHGTQRQHIPVELRQQTAHRVYRLRVVGKVTAERGRMEKCR